MRLSSVGFNPQTQEGMLFIYQVSVSLLYVSFLEVVKGERGGVEIIMWFLEFGMSIGFVCGLRKRR